jgi:Tfp pilus assembly protein PilE
MLLIIVLTLIVSLSYSRSMRRVYKNEVKAGLERIKNIQIETNF